MRTVIDIPTDGIAPYGCVPANRAAELVGVSHTTVAKLIARGEVDAFRQGRRLWIRIEDVESLAARRRRHQ